MPTEMAAPVGRCPYKGLATYQPEDAHVFFGREKLVDDVVRRFQLNRVLFVGGPSGSGKSSLVRAGLIPALKAGALSGSEDWRLALFTPGRAPLAELYFQLTRQMSAATPPVSLEEMLNHPTMARHLADADDVVHPLLICIDQFEELFTLAPAAQQDRFYCRALRDHRSRRQPRTDGHYRTRRLLRGLRPDSMAGGKDHRQPGTGQPHEGVRI